MTKILPLKQRRKIITGVIRLGPKNDYNKISKEHFPVVSKIRWKWIL